MKAFDIEKAKAGAEVCTRDKRAVRIIEFNKRSVCGHTIVALIDNGATEELHTYFNNGRIDLSREKNEDLFLVGSIEERWANIYADDTIRACGSLYYTEEDAIAHKDDEEGYIATVMLEWEE